MMGLPVLLVTLMLVTHPIRAEDDAKQNTPATSKAADAVAVAQKGSLRRSIPFPSAEVFPMRQLMLRLWKADCGALIATEWVLVATILVGGPAGTPHRHQSSCGYQKR
jgi:hypothetical protein